MLALRALDFLQQEVTGDSHTRVVRGSGFKSDPNAVDAEEKGGKGVRQEWRLVKVEPKFSGAGGGGSVRG